MLQPKQQGFEIDEAKEYYYGTFKKSQQYSTNLLKGKRLPDWSHGKAYKMGTMEFVEFPLVQEKKHVSVPGNLSPEDKKRIISATISRIAFIKLANGNVKTRLIQYIPDLDYLRKSNYDISHNQFNNVDKDFSGVIEVTDWSGKLVEGLVLNNGKAAKTIVKRKPVDHQEQVSTNSVALLSEGCGYIVTTDYVVECVYTYQGDVLVSVDCEEPQVTGVTVSEYGCDTPCMNEEGGPDEQCVCDQLNLCDGNNEEEIECNIESYEAQSMISEIYSNSETIVDLSGGATGPEVTDAFGKITRTKKPKWPFYIARFGAGFNATYTAYFDAIQAKINNGPWKWETLTYLKQEKSSGKAPPCIGFEVSMHTVNINFSTDKFRAYVELDFTTSAFISCVNNTEIGQPQEHTLSDDIHVDEP